MNFLVQGFNVLLYQPILNVLILLYVALPGNDFGLAIILLTLLLRLVLFPISRKALLNQRKLAMIQPKLREIQSRTKDRAEQSKQIMALYQQAKLNPLTALLPQLLQLPILIALYRAFWHGLNTEQLNLLYAFMPRPDVLHASFLGLIDLNQPHLVLAILASFMQYYQTKMLQVGTPLNKKTSKDGKPDFQTILQKQSMYLLPLFTFTILLQFPSALALYWLTSSFFAIAEQKWLIKKLPINDVATTSAN